jgi:carboxyl-terminal processing protease
MRTGLRRPAQYGVALLFSAIVTGGASAATLPADPVRQDAEACERAGQWDQAVEAYSRLLARDRQQVDVRTSLQRCLRRAHQTHRHRDPVYRSKVLSLPVSQALDLYVEILTRLHDQYADPEKVPFAALFGHGLEEFRAALSEPTFLREHMDEVAPAALTSLRRHLATFAFDVADVREARARVRDLAWEAQRLTSLNPTVAVLEFACGASNALDEYTLFVTPGQPVEDPARLSGALAAYGVLVDWKDRQLVIERVVAGSWAADRGLQAGDRIVRVGRQPLDRLLPEAVTALLRGDATSVATLTVRHEDAAARVVDLPTFVPSVMDERIERDGIGYIRVANFQKTTLEELDAALLRLRSEGMRVLVLDLRGNSGGSFAAAIQVADRFLPAGVIVSTQGQVRSYSKTYTARHPMAANDIPLVVLVDGDTASAAEILAAALKDNDRALLVGQSTYGKGSIQKLLPLQAGSGLYLTLARWYGPHGQAIAGVGVSPHFVEPRREPMKDAQLEMALEQASRLLAMR